MDKGSQFLSDLVLNRSYAGLKEDGRKEEWSEVVVRVLDHHCSRFPWLHREILEVCLQPLLEKKVVPAMRWLQFAGEGIRRSEVRGYNCSFTTISSFRDFAEVFYILMCGTGVGYSVQGRHVQNLPPISRGRSEVFVIEDRKESWADSVVSLLLNPSCSFDYSRIREAGAPLSTGGTASGPESLMLLHARMRSILEQAEGRKLRPLEVHDLICQIAEGVVVGGVRRAALICLFDWTDEEMLQCKFGQWWEHAPWRARANNSAVIGRDDEQARYAFEKVIEACYESESGEPGVYWTNDYDSGANPCVEISLRSKQFCNLTEVNLSACRDDADVQSALSAAAVLGTMQAAYTDFPYISKSWESNCREEALLGVSLTGQARAWDLLEDAELLQNWANTTVRVNKIWADRLGINQAARITCTKPSGTASAFLGTTSGIHAAHSEHYLRRVRLNADHPISRYLENLLPKEFFELDSMSPGNTVVSVPIRMPNAIHREHESALELLERMKHISVNWIRPAHRQGPNMHNVSLTATYRSSEKRAIQKWMWENRSCYSGISLFPFSGHSYQQAPFESITEDEYSRLSHIFPTIDFSQISYHTDDTRERESELSCAGQSCEWV